jgi:predicted RNA-binding protein with PUA-like domain
VGRELPRVGTGDFSHVFRVDSDPYEDPNIAAKYNGASACDCTLRAALQRPITLDQIRQDRVLSTWPAAQVGFHGTAFPIEPSEWRALVARTDSS